MKEFLKEGLAVISVQPKPNDPKELKEEISIESLEVHSVKHKPNDPFELKDKISIGKPCSPFSLTQS